MLRNLLKLGRLHELVIVEVIDHASQPPVVCVKYGGISQLAAGLPKLGMLDNPLHAADEDKHVVMGVGEAGRGDDRPAEGPVDEVDEGAPDLGGVVNEVRVVAAEEAVNHGGERAGADGRGSTMLSCAAEVVPQ